MVIFTDPPYNDLIDGCPRRRSARSFLGKRHDCYGSRVYWPHLLWHKFDSRYVDAIIRRWQTFTVKTTVHEKSGRPFAELKHEVTHEG